MSDPNEEEEISVTLRFNLHSIVRWSRNYTIDPFEIIKHECDCASDAAYLEMSDRLKVVLNDYMEGNTDE